MEQITVQVGKDNSVMLCCPFCGVAKSVSLDKFKDVKHVIIVRCGCNNRFQVHLNFRKNYRKSLTLPGEFMILPSTTEIWRKMIVCDLSRTGMGFEMIDTVVMNKDVELRVRFNLDNNKRTLIDKKVIARFVGDDGFIGCEFVELNLYEKELGFYLMP
ncbi:MAG: PilZ domain-containing protein [Pseudomonadota bacterium]